MPKRTQAPFVTDPVSAAAEAGVMLYAMMAPLPKLGKDGAPPEWITVFPQLGQVVCRDTRTFAIDAQTLLDTFAGDELDLPIDINHGSEWGVGENARAVGWISELRADANRLEARVEWCDEGIELLKARKFRYLSPAFYADDLGKAIRLKAVSLVNTPALARQPALASAASSLPPTSEPFPMKSFALALGLAEAATEAECLTALKERLTTSVSKAVHDETLAQLSAASTELAEIKKATRDSKVEGLVEAALAAKKITPAEREHYVALCASDNGLAEVEKLLAAKTPLLPGSGLDKQKQPDGGEEVSQDPVKLAGLAAELVDKEEAAGRKISLAEAMTRITEKRD